MSKELQRLCAYLTDCAFKYASGVSLPPCLTYAGGFSSGQCSNVIAQLVIKYPTAAVAMGLAPSVSPPPPPPPPPVAPPPPPPVAPPPPPPVAPPPPPPVAPPPPPPVAPPPPPPVAPPPPPPVAPPPPPPVAPPPPPPVAPPPPPPVAPPPPPTYSMALPAFRCYPTSCNCTYHNDTSCTGSGCEFIGVGSYISALDVIGSSNTSVLSFATLLLGSDLNESKVCTSHIDSGDANFTGNVNATSCLDVTFSPVASNVTNGFNVTLISFTSPSFSMGNQTLTEDFWCFSYMQNICNDASVLYNVTSSLTSNSTINKTGPLYFIDMGASNCYPLIYIPDTTQNCFYSTGRWHCGNSSGFADYSESSNYIFPIEVSGDQVPFFFIDAVYKA